MSGPINGGGNGNDGATDDGKPDDQAGGNNGPDDTGKPGNDGATDDGNGKPATGDQDAADKSGDGKGDNGKGSGDGETDWKAHSRTWEGRAKENKTALDKVTAERDESTATLAAVRKAFGLDKNEDEDDPKTVAERAQAAADAKDAEIRTMRIERVAEKAGRKAGADVDELLDLRSFANALAKLDDTADTFDKDVAALVDKTLEDRPHLRAQRQTPPPSSEDMTGGGETGRSGGDSGGAGAGDDIDSIRAERQKRRAG